MSALPVLIALLGVVALVPRVLARSAGGEPLFGIGNDPAVLTAVRIGALGTLIVLAILYMNSK